MSDLRLALRALARTPALTIAALLCLAIGIAANTTVFTASNALALHPVPTPNSDRLVMLAETPPRQSATNEDFQSIAPANLIDWQRQSTKLESVAAFSWWDVNITGVDEPERVTGFRVTPNFFSLLGERPLIGRPFTREEGRDGQNASVILSAPLWRRRFASDPGVIGRTLQLNGATHTIVGVMGDDFIFPPAAELWAVRALDGALATERDGRLLRAIGRLKPGVTLDEARAEARTIARRLELQYPDMNAKWGMRVEWADRFYGRHPRQYLIVLMAAVGFVLLIACANVANLLLARASTRHQELAIRVALGATRGNLVRHLFAEGIVLALASGALGTLLSLWGVRLFRSTLPAELLQFNPGWTRIVVDARALLFTCAVAMGTALAVGVAPALIASRADPQHALKEGARSMSVGGRRLRLRGVLVVLEVALALMLLVGTGLMLRSFRGLLSADPGYTADHVLSMQLTVPAARHPAVERVTDFYHTLIDRLAEVPGVRGAAAASILPPSWDDNHQRFYLEGQPVPQRGDAVPEVRARVVSPTYFDVMRIARVRGRTFTRDDAPGRPRVAVVSEALARQFWPTTDAVGRRFTMLGDTTLTTVVGVVRDVRHNPNTGSEPLSPTLYVPMEQAQWRSMSIVVRTTQDPASVAGDVQRVIGSIDPTLAAGTVRPLERVVRLSLAPQGITAWMLAVFAGIAVLLAAIGIYGVTSYTVSQRTHEIGIRLALGAQRRTVLGNVLRQSMTRIAIGVLFGLAGAAGLTRGLRTLLYDVSPTDPLIFGGVAALLVAVALLGSYLPARRATRIDPVSALRAQG